MKSLNRDLFPGEEREDFYSHLFISGLHVASQTISTLTAQELVLTRATSGPTIRGKSESVVETTENIKIARELTTHVLNISFHQAQSWLGENFEPSLQLLRERLQSPLGSLFYIPLKVTRNVLLKSKVSKKLDISKVRVKMSLSGEPREYRSVKRRHHHYLHRYLDSLDVGQDELSRLENARLAEMLHAAHQTLPRSMGSITDNSVHSVLFRQKLMSDGHSTLPIDFCDDVGDLVGTMDRNRLEMTTAAIQNKYFSDVAHMKETDTDYQAFSKSIKSNSHGNLERPALDKMNTGFSMISLPTLVRIRKFVMSHLEKRHLRDYRNTLPKNVKELKSRDPEMTALAELTARRRKRFLLAFSNVAAFIRSMENSQLYNGLHAYIREVIKVKKTKLAEHKGRRREGGSNEVRESHSKNKHFDSGEASTKAAPTRRRTGKKDGTPSSNQTGSPFFYTVDHPSPQPSHRLTEVTPGGVEYNLEKVPNDLTFLHEVTRYKRLVDDLKDSELVPQVGFTPFGFQASPMTIQRQKANAIITCSLQSDYSPVVQINISPHQATRIQQSYTEHGPTRQLFHKAFIRVFPIVFGLWKRFMDEWSIREVGPEGLAKVLARIKEKEKMEAKARFDKFMEADQYELERGLIPVVSTDMKSLTYATFSHADSAEDKQHDQTRRTISLSKQLLSFLTSPQEGHAVKERQATVKLRESTTSQTSSLDENAQGITTVSDKAPPLNVRAQNRSQHNDNNHVKPPPGEKKAFHHSISALTNTLRTKKPAPANTGATTATNLPTNGASNTPGNTAGNIPGTAHGSEAGNANKSANWVRSSTVSSATSSVNGTLSNNYKNSKHFPSIAITMGNSGNEMKSSERRLTRQAHRPVALEKGRALLPHKMSESRLERGTKVAKCRYPSVQTSAQVAASARKKSPRPHTRMPSVCATRVATPVIPETATIKRSDLPNSLCPQLPTTNCIELPAAQCTQLPAAKYLELPSPKCPELPVPKWRRCYREGPNGLCVSFEPNDGTAPLVTYCSSGKGHVRGHTTASASAPRTSERNGKKIIRYDPSHTLPECPVTYLVKRGARKASHEKKLTAPNGLPRCLSKPTTRN